MPGMDLPPDYVREQLEKLRVIKVEVVLATALMKKRESGTINPFPGHASTINEIAQSYSWPRVTFQVGDKIKRIPMTFMPGVRKIMKLDYQQWRELYSE